MLPPNHSSYPDFYPGFLPEPLSDCLSYGNIDHAYRVERNSCPPNKRKSYIFFTFLIFMMTYIPIAVCALFQKITWKPIEHTVVKSIEDFQ